MEFVNFNIKSLYIKLGLHDHR